VEAYETAVEFLRLLKEKGFQAGSFDFSTPTTQQWIRMVTWAHWLSEKEAKRNQQDYTPFHAWPC
jgi:hypothetical protein